MSVKMALHCARIHPFSEMTTVTGSFSIMACWMPATSWLGASANAVRPPAEPVSGRTCRALADFPGDGLPLLGVGGEQRLDSASFRRSERRIPCGLEFLELAQRAQPHIEDRLGLVLGERQRAIITCFGSSSSR